MAVTKVTCKVTASTRISSTKPTSALSAAAQSQLAVKSGQAHSFVQFGLPRDLGGSVVLSAKLQLWATGVWGGTRTLTAQRISGPRTYSKMTWKNSVSNILAAGSTARTGGPAGARAHEIDLTDDFQLIASGAKYYGHRILGSEDVARFFYGRTNATQYPRLILEYARETPAPAQVSPDGVVGVAKPTFTWAASSDITKVQAQADVVGGSFAAPSWDSGDLVTNLGNVNTNAAGWSGLADGGSADLRFRQYGSLGWSLWSLPVTVTREDYPVLTTTLPTPGGTSNDPTPQHDWTFAGQTQFQLQIRDASNRVLYDSGVVASDDDSWTPVASSFKVSSKATLTSVLRVWDDVDGRVASPGDPGYVERRWSWTITPTAATTGVTGFSAQVSAERPVVRLSWSRATGAADEFVVYRNGLQVARFDGGEHQVSSTTWRFEDWSVEPNRESVYKVHAVVAGKMSLASSAVSVQFDLNGLVIYEPLSGAWFNVAGPSAGDNLSKGEASVMYRSPFAQAPIKRVMSLGGLGGNVSGFLHPYGDRPVLEQLADVATVRANPTRECRLIWGFENVPVTVSMLSPVLSSDAVRPSMMHKVDFTVDQVDEFDTDVTGAED
ncbi:DNRLRE domain-containing protein [Nocardioides aurantiacus]|uniref:Uncharacterized protein n=1 Tax=Nocardioides aurantiacus TaxID=86796 RepID=A0A3N2CWD4_9ACTN|nr:DNRLRE domain-containing protein [Nocardioides aurantiacus]ROR91776.1 hypothetical protein EDD33_2651 [Nocardioides aurantiacus]